MVEAGGVGQTPTVRPAERTDRDYTPRAAWPDEVPFARRGEGREMAGSAYHAAPVSPRRNKVAHALRSAPRDCGK